MINKSFIAITFTAAAIAGGLVLFVGRIEIHPAVAQANDSGDNNQGGSCMPGSMSGCNPTFHKEDRIFTPEGAALYGYVKTGARLPLEQVVRLPLRRPTMVAQGKPIRVRVAAATPARKPISDRCNLGSERCENKDRDVGSGKLEPATHWAVAQNWIPIWFR